MIKIIRVFDAFSGIGGFRSAFERVGGFEMVGWCEKDKYAQKAYRALYETGGEEFYEDIRSIDTEKLADFDLLVGGFPCQPFSVAGMRKSFKDERGDLFFELARLLEAKRPKYCLFENVPGILSAEKGQAYAKILETLSQLGYFVEWFVHDSSDFGVPQKRGRVYIAGCLGRDCSGQILAFGESNSKNSGKVQQIIGGSQGQRVYDPEGLAVTQCSGSGGMGGKTGLYLIDMNAPPNLTDTARCITARQDSGVSNRKGEHSAVFVDLNENPQITDNADVGDVLRFCDSKIGGMLPTKRNSQSNAAAFDFYTKYDLGVSSGTHKGERSGVLVEEGPRAIINPFKEKTYQNGRRIKEPNEPMFTLTVTDRHGVIHKGRIRRLMPIEC